MDKRDQPDISPDDEIDTKPEHALDTDSVKYLKATTEADEAALEATETTDPSTDTKTTEFEHTVSVDTEPATGEDAATTELAATTSDETSRQLPADDSTTTPSDKPPRDLKRTIILAIIAVVVIISGAIVFWLALKPVDTEEQRDSVAAPIEQPKLGVAISVADGTVEFSTSDDAWQPLTSESQISEGITVRTAEGSRAVLTLDDGSAVRIDALSSVKFTSLVADNIRIDQLSGIVYSRVVPSERKYAVVIDDMSYQALGTAFVTVKTENESGVQVMQSSVKASGTEAAVTEGKQYYKTSSNSELKGKVTDIDLGTLAGNEFIIWNLSEDEKDAKFKDKLGVLNNVKRLAAEQEATRTATEAERKKLEAEQSQKASDEKDKNEKDKHDQSKSKVTRGQMSLALQGDTLSWSYTGHAPHGYKLVYAEHDSPTFGSDKAIYLSDQGTLSTQIPKDFKKHKAYKVRLCAYTAGTEADKCVDYSNVVQVTRTS